MAVPGGSRFAAAPPPRAARGRSGRRRWPHVGVLALLLGGLRRGHLAGVARPVVVRDDDADGRPHAQGRRAGARVHQILAAQHRPPRVRAAAGCVSAAVAAREAGARERRSRAWMRNVISDAGGAPRRSFDLGTKRPGHLLPVESERAEASRNDPHWWHDPRNARAAVGRVRDALVANDPGGATDVPCECLSIPRAGCARSTPAIARLLPRASPAAQRKLVSDQMPSPTSRSVTGSPSIGAVIPSQDHPGAGLGPRPRGSSCGLIRRERVARRVPGGSLSAKLAQQIAHETGAQADYTLYGDRLGSERVRAARRTLSMEPHDARLAPLVPSRAGVRQRPLLNLGSLGVPERPRGQPPQQAKDIRGPRSSPAASKIPAGGSSSARISWWCTLVSV